MTPSHLQDIDRQTLSLNGFVPWMNSDSISELLHKAWFKLLEQ